MSAWTDWRLIADKKYWYIDRFDWDGPACYELALAVPQGDNLKIMYVGETKNEKQRLSEYARSGSHLSEEISNHLRQGWYLLYRAQAMFSKEEAKIMQDNLLGKFEYPWNIVNNL